jgi:hypothetical protein
MIGTLEIGRHPRFVIRKRHSQSSDPNAVQNAAEIKVRAFARVPVRQNNYGRAFVFFEWKQPCPHRVVLGRGALDVTLPRSSRSFRPDSSCSTSPISSGNAKYRSLFSTVSRENSLKKFRGSPPLPFANSVPHSNGRTTRLSFNIAKYRSRRCMYHLSIVRTAGSLPA